MKVRWISKASHDLRRVADYLQDEAPPVANRIVTEIYSKAMGLGGTPYVGKAVENTGIRKLVVLDTYLIYYRIANDTVHILRVRHGAQKPLKF